MIAAGEFRWVLLAALVGCYLLLCLRTALAMARTGRSFWKWLLITVFTTSIPATMVLLREQARRLRTPPGPRPSRRPPPARRSRPRRCPHCGQPVRTEELDHTGGLAVCPHCSLPVDSSEVG